MAIVFCPVTCDRYYVADTRKEAEEKAKKHVDGQHPDYPNPFYSEED